MITRPALFRPGIFRHAMGARIVAPSGPPPEIRTLAFIGSSSVERNQAAISAYRFFTFYGFANHACARLQQRVMLAYNASKNTYEFGTAGASSDALLLNRVPEAIAAAPDAAVIYDGMTEAANATPAATALARTQAIYDALRAGGIKTVIVMATGPRNAAAVSGTGYWARQQAINALRQAWCASNNIPYYDLNANVQNPTTGDWLTGYTSDGIHPNDVGASIIGRDLAAAMQADTRYTLAPSPWTTARIAALRGINPSMTGGTTTATGYVAFAAAGALTPSKVAATDGGNGWQRIVLNAAARSNVVQFRAPSNTPIALPSGIAAGDLVRMWAEYEPAAGTAHWRHEASVSFDGTGAPAIGIGASATDSGITPAWPTSMVVCSPVVAIPANATNMRMNMDIANTCDIKIRNWGIEKVNSYAPPAIGS